MFRLFCILSCFSLLIARPPQTIPQKHLNEFTMGGKVVIYPFYRDDTYSKPRPYTKDLIRKYEEGVSKRQSFYYGDTDQWLYKALDNFPNAIQGKSVAIIGSVEPLYECVTLAWGGKPVTIEYNKLTTEDSRFTLLTVDEYEKNPVQFDAILCISSIEHDGLGRYGDALNPKGDLEAMEKMYAMLKDDGYLFLALPVGRDAIYFNAHRVYGRHRLPLILKKWNVVGQYGMNQRLFLQDIRYPFQPVFVLQKK